MNEGREFRSIDLEGRRALATGGSRGVGAVVCQELAAVGAHVFISFRSDETGAKRTCRAIGAAGGTATLVPANLLRSDEIRGMMAEIASSGPLDVIVHCAALGSFKPTLDVRPNQWDLSVGVSARAFLLCVQHAMPLLAGRAARVVAVSSLGSTRVVPGYGAIGASKAALESLVRSLAVELAPRGVRVNGVSAGILEGTSIAKHPGYAELAARVRGRTPAGRLGTPEDLARVVLWLCSPLADWIVGQTIVADGGLSLVL